MNRKLSGDQLGFILSDYAAIIQIFAATNSEEGWRQLGNHLSGELIQASMAESNLG